MKNCLITGIINGSNQPLVRVPRLPTLLTPSPEPQHAPKRGISPHRASLQPQTLAEHRTAPKTSQISVNSPSRPRPYLAAGRRGLLLPRAARGRASSSSSSSSPPSSSLYSAPAGTTGNAPRSLGPPVIN